MNKLTPPVLLATLALCSYAVDVDAFCGFYVAQADTKLFNKASKVVMVRDGDKTVLTMANDYEGSLKQFAIVVPVPQVIKKDMVRAGDKALLDRVDAWSAPRLVEYHDENPCDRRRYELDRATSRGAPPPMPMAAPSAARAKSLGVTIEDQYTVGEYDILVLSAKQSDGLATWLKENKYKIPDGAEDVLGSYIKQNMKFFVAKVNLAEQDRLGFGYLRPLVVSYESPKFMLPIRLGTVNANGPQDLIVFALTKQGRVETTNYKNARIPTGNNIPEYTKDVFGEFYKSMFAKQVEKEDMRAVFLEHAWDMGWCDPCAADPLTPAELKGLGVWWLDEGAEPQVPGGVPQSMRRAPPRMGGAQNVYLTRLHARYDREHFPEDLVFQQTSDRANFQGRYVMQHAYKGATDCAEADAYWQGVAARQKAEAATLIEMTGWTDVEQKIRQHAPLPTSTKAPEAPETPTEPANDLPKPKSWWDRIFGD